MFLSDQSYPAKCAQEISPWRVRQPSGCILNRLQPEGGRCDVLSGYLFYAPVRMPCCARKQVTTIDAKRYPTDGLLRRSVCGDNERANFFRPPRLPVCNWICLRC